MFRSLIAVVLLCLLVVAPARTVFAQTNSSQDDPRVQELKSKLREIGEGEKARVLVTFRDKSKVKGYVSAIDAAAFTIRTKDHDRTIAYGDVKDIRKQGMRMFPIWIGLGAGAAYVIIQTILRPAFGG